MAIIQMKIDGKDIVADSGLSILEVCRKNGIHIPTLCYDDRLGVGVTCNMCMVEIEGASLTTACSTEAKPEMVIQTNSDAVRARRKEILEGLLADHYGDCVSPCQLACPARTDIQGYISLIGQGRYHEAVDLIRESNPLPATLGRICPHPCEAVCRRSVVDEPLSICSLRRFAADYDLRQNGKPATPAPAKSGFRVAIVGAGPAGLSAAYYLAQLGHEVVVFEALPEAGGMLYYGIPDYRLPKDVLDQEIGLIRDLGVTVKTNVALGRDFTLESLFEDGFRAVLLAIGAHRSQRLNVPGEDLPGVLSGIDFLRSVAMKQPVEIGRRVAVVGGGHTALDVARTALRHGAEEVAIVYRRTRNEMPASEWEIEEAEEEHVRLEFLAAPSRIVEDNGHVGSLVCFRMTLGEPDASGRPRPVPVPDSDFVLEVDTVIAAIGQIPDVSCLPDKEREVAGIGVLRLGRGDSLVADRETMCTDMKGVFAAGDAAGGAGIAIAAIAGGKKAALSIDRYLRGVEWDGVKRQFNVSKGNLDQLNQADFAGYDKRPRASMPKLEVEERLRGSDQIDLGFAEESARREAERCLECGCKAAAYCELRRLATEYGVSMTQFGSYKTYRQVDKSHPYIELDPNKCIMCARCARVCSQIQGVGAITFEKITGNTAFRLANLGCYRWAIDYDMRILGGPDGPTLLETGCESCGLCVDVCPVGALADKNNVHPSKLVKTVCPHCSIGCGIYVGARGEAIIGAQGDVDSPVNEGDLCVRGRYGLSFVNDPTRLTSPLVRRDGQLVKATWEEALDLVASRLASHKGERFAALASAKSTNEDNFVLQKFVRSVMGNNNVDFFGHPSCATALAGLNKAFGGAAATNTIGEIGDAAGIIAIGTDITVDHPIIGLEIKRAVKLGAKLIVVDPQRIDLCRFADQWLQLKPGSDTALIMGIIKVIVDEGLADSAFIEERTANFEALKAAVKEVDLSLVEEVTGVSPDRIVEAARTFATSKPAAIVFGSGITNGPDGLDSVLGIANLALATGNVGKASSGIYPLEKSGNVQGTIDVGCLPDALAGGQRVDDPEARARFEAAWGVALNGTPGLGVSQILSAAGAGQIDVLFVVGEDPVASEADGGNAREALAKVGFMVVQDAFLTETARLADVVFPATTFAEKDGTFTNVERRVQRMRKVIDPIGDSRDGWWSICAIAQRLGASGFDFASSEEIMAEIASLTPSYSGITYDRLEFVGLQWPCFSPEDGGTPVLHAERFETLDGKGRFTPLRVKRPSAKSGAEL